MRGIRLTKDEVSLIEQVFNDSYFTSSMDDNKSFKARNSILSKISSAQAPSVNPSIKPLEDILVSNAGGKVIPLSDPLGYARASRQAGLLGLNDATGQDFATMGIWINTQAWIKTMNGFLTILDVLNKWSQWFPKAKASNVNTGQSPNKSGQGITGRRPASGLR